MLRSDIYDKQENDIPRNHRGKQPVNPFSANALERRKKC